MRLGGNRRVTGCGVRVTGCGPFDFGFVIGDFGLEKPASKAQRAERIACKAESQELVVAEYAMPYAPCTMLFLIVWSCLNGVFMICKPLTLKTGWIEYVSEISDKCHFLRGPERRVK